MSSNNEDVVGFRGECNKGLQNNDGIDLHCKTSPSALCFEKEIQKLEYFCCLIGTASNQTNAAIRTVGSVIWAFILTFHFSFGVYEAFKVYGYTFLCAQSISLIAFLVFTWSTKYRTLPWLLKGLKELNSGDQYEKSVTKMLKFLKNCPYLLILFGLVAAVIQHICLYFDDITNIQFGLKLPTGYVMLVNCFRFLCSVYFYAAYGLFWIIPTCVILMTGHAMTEYMDEMGEKMRNKECVLTFKEAISTYSKRAKFVKTSSSSSLILLTSLILTGVCCFGLNVYIFLFNKRRYLLIWHSLLPLAVMIYPLCSAAWVTRQYNWFIIVVVRAWVQRDDLDESSDDDNDNAEDIMLQKNQTKTFSQSKSDLKFTRLESRVSDSVTSYQKNIPITVSSDANIKDTSGETSSKDDKNNNFIMSVGTAKAAAKFSMPIKKPRFNFEKFLSYLESMQTVVGFQIAGIVVTWDIVSTSLFLVFSIVAVFLQESIFGSQKSTL